MAQFGAIYLSFEEADADKVEAISDIMKQGGFLFAVRYFHPKPWIQFYAEEPENTPYYAEQVSKIFPDRRVIGMGVYTVSDSTVFCEFRNGEALRILESGFQQERVWGKIEGQPQDWEAEILAGNEMELGSSGMMSYDIQKIGQYMGFPGFGEPGAGQSWTKEIFN